MTDRISLSQFREADGVEDWRILSEGAYARFLTGSFAAGAEFAGAIARIPDLDAHHPDLDIRHDAVTVRLVTYADDYFGLSRRDIELAVEISGLARERGLTPDPASLRSLLIVPGASNVGDVMPFWRAVLGYEPRSDSPAEDLVDPAGRDASFWFEQMDEPRPGGQGAIHVGVFVPDEVAEARVAAALAAGGRIVRDRFAPMWWTVADAAGNEADIATTIGR